MQKSTAMTRMKTKDFFGLLEKDNKVNWAHQTKLLKKLMGKFSDGEIIYAINYWKKKGLPIKSYGFLTYNNFTNMKEPASLYKAEKANTIQGGDSSERNKLRVEHNSETYSGIKSYFDLFETSGEDS